MIELRYDEQHQLDEVVARAAYVHLERMDDTTFSLIVEADGRRICVSVSARKQPVTAAVVWDEPV